MRQPALSRSWILVVVFVAALFAPASAEDKQPAPGGIQWFATWTDAAAEARRTERPILLIAAAPHCRNISGMW
ncbi:MAG: hypothetical protein O2894_11350 [Planctomycetota bacterium]|nr:hypothetical protein [Planctomycetota bacterium]